MRAAVFYMTFILQLFQLGLHSVSQTSCPENPPVGDSHWLLVQQQKALLCVGIRQITRDVAVPAFCPVGLCGSCHDLTTLAGVSEVAVCRSGILTGREAPAGTLLEQYAKKIFL